MELYNNNNHNNKGSILWPFRPICCKLYNDKRGGCILGCILGRILGHIFGHILGHILGQYSITIISRIAFWPSI